MINCIKSLYKTTIFILLLITSLIIHIIEITALKLSPSFIRNNIRLAPPFFINDNFQQLEDQQLEDHDNALTQKTIEIKSIDDETQTTKKSKVIRDSNISTSTKQEIQSIINRININNERKTTLHICILVHGHKGQSIDLSYLKSALLTEASQRINQDDAQNNQLLLVHSSTCNEDKTDDGIINGGNRLTNEILQLMNDVSTNNDLLENITLSFVGNSLGGLYARYAVKLLHELLSPKQNNKNTDSTSIKIPISYNVFVSTATPHLGVSKHTYIPLSRSIETKIAKIMGKTGEDLFRVNNLLHTMATSEGYLQPLQSFNKRILYANAYHTDFPVPFDTAAFLNEKSDSLHTFIDDDDEGMEEVVISEKNQEDDFIIAMVHTHKNNATTADDNKSKDNSNKQDDDDLVAMCNSLDSLGWTKVFIDLRPNIPLFLPLPSSFVTSLPNISLANIPFPNISIPIMSSSITSTTTPAIGTTATNTKSSFLPKTFNIKKSITNNNNENQQSKEITKVNINKKKKLEETIKCIHSYKNNISKEITSSNLSRILSAPKEKLTLPIGHNMIVAFSRNKVSSIIHKGGRPVMDELAKNIVHYIFNWDDDEMDSDIDDEEKENNLLYFFVPNENQG